MSDANSDVLVVGAGPVGLVAAAELARQGVRPRLIDSLAEPSELSRAVIVHSRSIDLLDALGALPRIEQRGQRVVGMQVVSADNPGKQRSGVALDEMPTRHPYGVNLAQTETEAALTERAAELGVPIERGTTLTALTQSDSGVEVTLLGPEGTERATFGWLVGTDGAHSTVRNLVGTKLDGRFKGQHFVFADVEAVTDLPRDSITMFAGSTGLAGVFPLAGSRLRLLFNIDAPTGDEPTVEQVQALCDTQACGEVKITAAHWLTYFEVHHGQVPQYRFGRVLLAGDAAHIHSPAGGQGMNTGMQDAANLAWKLALVAGGRADATLLDSYHAERHPIGAGVVKLTTAMTKLVSARAVRDLAVLVVGHVHKAQEALADRLAELTVGYPKSPIVGHAGSTRGVQPGMHAPDVAGLQRPNGTPCWIGDLLRRPGHLVLLRTGSDDIAARMTAELGSIGTVVRVVDGAAGAPADALVDPAGAVADAYGIGADGFAAIRPDGYVGYLATPAEPAALRRYLDDCLAVQRAGARA